MRNTTSDHDGVIFSLHLRDIQIKEQFYMSRDYGLITFNNIDPLLKTNHNIQSIFNSSNPEFIAERLITGLNEIIDELAPRKRFQKK